MSYGWLLLLDLTLVAACATVLVRFGRLSHSHPGTIYLVFHLYTFSWRLSGLAMGAPPLFSDWGPFYDAVRPDEIQRATHLGQIALIVVTIAWLLAARDARVVFTGTTETVPSQRLNRSLVWWIAAVAMPFGIYGLYAFAPQSIMGTRDAYDPLAGFQESSYVQILPQWPGLLVLALIYLHGFRWWLVTPMTAYLGYMSLQGYHRFRVIVPILLMIQIALDRRNRRWPRAGVVAGLVVMAFAFFPLKGIGKMAQQGASATDIATMSAEVAGDAIAGRADDQAFLDEYAVAVSAFEEHGKLFLGAPYLAVLTLPIPRQLWPGKPSPSDYIRQVSSPRRPIGETGMVVTFLGEAYANFGILGVVIVPALLAYSLGLAYFAAYRRARDSVARFAYLMLACNLIQVYRDGLSSIVIFTAVNMMPLVIIIVAHRALAGTRNSSRAFPIGTT